MVLVKLESSKRMENDTKIYLELNRTAGFNQFPIGVSEVAEGGFKTDRDTLRKLSMRAKGDMKEFVDLIIRYNAIDTYLNTFVNGIRDHVNTDSILHPKFKLPKPTTRKYFSYS